MFATSHNIAHVTVGTCSEPQLFFLSFSLGSTSVVPPEMTLCAGRSLDQLPWPCEGGPAGQRQGPFLSPMELAFTGDLSA